MTHASRVFSQGSLAIPELRLAVKNGQINVTDASRVLDQPLEVQRAGVEMLVNGEAKTISSAVRKIQQEAALGEAAGVLAANRALSLGDTVKIHAVPVDGLRALVEPASVDLIVSHPPHGERTLHLLAGLAAFASHALKPGGVMVVVGSGTHLLQMLEHLAHPGIEWGMELDLLLHGPPGRSGSPHFINLRRWPILVFGKPGFRLSAGDDLIQVPHPEELPEGCNRNEAAMALILDRFARPGQVVCDPIMLDRSGVALAARQGVASSSAPVPSNPASTGSSGGCSGRKPPFPAGSRPNPGMMEAPTAARPGRLPAR